MLLNDCYLCGLPKKVGMLLLNNYVGFDIKQSYNIYLLNNFRYKYLKN